MSDVYMYMHLAIGEQEDYNSRNYFQILPNFEANINLCMYILFLFIDSLSTSFAILFEHRTGKRTLLGALKDGYNSAIRYYYNNFQDGYRQVSRGCQVLV